MELMPQHEFDEEIWKAQILDDLTGSQRVARLMMNTVVQMELW